MFGPLILLAASVTPLTLATAPAAERASGYRPASSATATAMVSIRVISGVRFGADHAETAAGAERRSAQLTDAAGATRSAELLEFQ